MKISYSWLKDYIKVDLEVDKLSRILTDIGLEVEGVEKVEMIKGGLNGLVVGEVVECEKHPDADRLSLTKVDIGSSDLLPIVCGAPNVAKGQKVVVATVGTTLYQGDEEFKIKKGKIRGQESLGMICAEDEIGLGNSHDGIMVLDNAVAKGTLAKDYFNVEDDIVFEIGLTPNRIDGASHIGVARDLAAYLRQTQDITYTVPSVDSFKIDNNKLPISVEIEDTNACKRYAGVSISGVQVKESPEWLKNRLKAIGLNPINNIVDISNYVLHETAQPLHIFDAKYITGNKIIVRALNDGSKFTTLDDVERKLSNQDLMVCNAEEGMCIAGVFGGIKSGVSDTTTDIFIESAYFNPVWVRKTSKRHALQTDSSFRFERGIDPNNTVYALKRAALLVQELAGGEISSELVDVYPNKIEDHTVEVKYSHINRLIGSEIGNEKIKNILQALEIQIVKEDGDLLELKVPAYRVDVTREADIIEEILRIYGYNNIEIPSKVKSTLAYAPKPDRNKLQNAVADMLSGLGFNEAMSNSLGKEEYYQKLEAFPYDNSVKILNSLSADLGVLRQTLLYDAMEAVKFNENHKNSNIKLYEFGHCYFFNNNANAEKPLDKYSEQEHLAVVMSGEAKEASWNTVVENSDFYHLKSYVEQVLRKLNYNIETIDQKEINNDVYSYGLSYILNGKTLVELGLVNKAIQQYFDTNNQVFYADFSWDNLMKYYSETKRFTPISKYPEVKRDLALLVNSDTRFADIKALAQKTERKLLKSVSIFDVYEGKNIEKGKKSYAVSFILQDDNKTLKDKQIDKIMNKFMQTFEKNLGAVIR